MVSITLPNGITINGVSEETLKSIIAGLEDGVHYISSTKGKMRIEDMATPHLRNAIAKKLRDSLESAKSLDTQAFVGYLNTGIGSESITTIAMVKELAERRDF